MRFLVVVMAVVVGLAGLSVGYALWGSTLQINTTAKTGFIDLEFVSFTCSDVPGQPDLGQTKDVASAECSLSDSDGDGGNDVLTITIINAYPGFQMMVNDVTIRGVGSVPVHITDTSFVFDDGDGALVMDLQGFWTDSNLVCRQIHAGDTITGDFWLYMSVEELALQNHTYTFTVSLDHAQWNQAPCPTPPQLCGTIGFWGTRSSTGSSPPRNRPAGTTGVA